MSEKTQKILRVIGYVMGAVLAVLSIVLIVLAIITKAVPTEYVIVFSILLFALIVGILFMQRWVVPGIIGKILALALVVVLAIGCSYLTYTLKKLKAMSSVHTQVDTIKVYVLKEDLATNLSQAKNYRFGIMRELDRENTDKMIAEVENEMGQALATTEYESAYDLVDALCNKDCDAIILNGAYEGILKDTQGYEEFETKVKEIGKREIVSTFEEFEVPEDYLYGGEHIFTVYISGADVEGKPSTNDRSDVNILMTVNLDTRQILLISTPRDYYIPLSISNGQKDKLTHAGMYGVDCSKDTLSMLYNVTVDDYIKINFTGFEQIIDAIGGITVHSDYAFSIEECSYVVGDNTCNGRQALMFARARKPFMDGDRQRGRNQMAVIQAIVDKLSASNIISNYKQLLDEVSGCMITSMSYDEIADLVKFQLADMRGWEILKYSVTGADSMNTTYSGGSQELYVMVPDEATVDQAKEYLRLMYQNKIIEVMPEFVEEGQQGVVTTEAQTDESGVTGNIEEVTTEEMEVTIETPVVEE